MADPVIAAARRRWAAKFAFGTTTGLVRPQMRVLEALGRRRRFRLTLYAAYRGTHHHDGSRYTRNRKGGSVTPRRPGNPYGGGSSLRDGS